MSEGKADWSLSKGYKTAKGRDVYPKRALYAGALFALELKFMVNDEDLDFTCGTSIQGYKVNRPLIHLDVVLSIFIFNPRVQIITRYHTCPLIFI